MSRQTPTGRSAITAPRSSPLSDEPRGIPQPAPVGPHSDPPRPTPPPAQPLSSSPLSFGTPVAPRSAPQCLPAHPFHGPAGGRLHRLGNWGHPPPHFCSPSGDPSREQQPCQEGGREEGRGSKAGQAPAPGDAGELPTLPRARLGRRCLPASSSSETPKTFSPPPRPLCLKLPPVLAAPT